MGLLAYSSIFALGHRAVKDLLLGEVLVEEKVDGSQFSFGVTPEGDIHVRSKGTEINVDAPEKMFTSAVETVKSLASGMVPGWTYRGEFLRTPKHNALAYERIPIGHIIIFDVNDGLESYLSYEDKKAAADRLGLETVPLLFSGRVTSLEQFKSLLETISILGGQKIEGVVVKPLKYDLFGQDKKVLMGKFVSEAFKEVHQKEWKGSNPNSRDILETLGIAYTSEARWQKAIQHLAEAGVLENSPKDIGKLLPAIQDDVEKECAEEIKDKLYSWAWPLLRRKLIAGFPEFYKQQLLEGQFEEKAA